MYTTNRIELLFVCFDVIKRGSFFDIVNLPYGPQRWYFCYLLFENFERASVSLLMLSGEQGNHWYHFFNVYGMIRSFIRD